VSPNFCEECGAPVTGAKFCSNCGTAIGVPEAVRPTVSVAAETQADETLTNGGALTPDAPPVLRPPVTTEQPVAAVRERPREDRAPSPPRERRPRALLIGVAVVAIVLAGAALAFVLLSSGDTEQDQAVAYERSVAKVFGPVLGANQQLSDELIALRGTDPSDARIAVQRAQRATTQAGGGLSAITVPAGSEEFASQARQALEREGAYLASVSNVLRNPSAASASQLQTLASNLSTALDAAGPAVAGTSQTISGADRLTAWAQNTAATLRKRAAAKRKAAAERRAEAREREQDRGGSTGTGSAPSTTVSGTNCGSGVTAGPNTSCPFALNVRSAYLQAPGLVTTVRVYSPTTGQTYSMSCRPSGAGTTCSGGNNASVSF
jgi:hypothetical protein